MSFTSLHPRWNHSWLLVWLLTRFLGETSLGLRARLFPRCGGSGATWRAFRRYLHERGPHPMSPELTSPPNTRAAVTRHGDRNFLLLKRGEAQQASNPSFLRFKSLWNHFKPSLPLYPKVWVQTASFWEAVGRVLDFTIDKALKIFGSKPPIRLISAPWLLLLSPQATGRICMLRVICGGLAVHLPSGSATQI